MALDAIINKGVAGIIGRDFQGKVVPRITCVFPVSSALQAEALALRESMVIASNLGIQCVVFENDNLELIQTCSNEVQRRELGAIVQDINSMKNGFSRGGFTWTPREGNEAAHSVANLAKRGFHNVDWVSNPPTLLRLVLQHDVCCA